MYNQLMAFEEACDLLELEDHDNMYEIKDRLMDEISELDDFHVQESIQYVLTLEKLSIGKVSKSYRFRLQREFFN